MSCEHPQPPPAESHLGGPVGVHLNHVLGTLFDLELDVILSFQGGQAAAAGAHSRLTVGRIWGQREFWVKKRRNKSYHLMTILETTTDMTPYVLLEFVTDTY